MKKKRVCCAGNSCYVIRGPLDNQEVREAVFELHFNLDQQNQLACNTSAYHVTARKSLV